jgi:hypothetical protein
MDTKASEQNKSKRIWKIEKYRNREDYEKCKPYEVSEFEGNIILDEGANAMWTLVAGGTETAFNAANSYLGVGDSSTAEAATQTGLQATTNKLYKGMVSGYPQYGTARKIVFKSEFIETEANFDWNEFTVANGNSDSAKNINRKVSAQGTKTSGQIWTLSLTIQTQ